jgi:DNA-binding MarR family transcriptional regulator
VTSWGFLTNHARVLLCIAHDPGVRLRHIADQLGITERSAHGIVTDLAEAGYVVKHKDGHGRVVGLVSRVLLPSYTTYYVPALLQTQEYTRAIINPR